MEAISVLSQFLKNTRWAIFLRKTLELFFIILTIDKRPKMHSYVTWYYIQPAGQYDVR